MEPVSYTWFDFSLQTISAVKTHREHFCSSPTSIYTDVEDLVCLRAAKVEHTSSQSSANGFLIK